MSRGATWTNNDGLVVGFGTHSADNDVAGVAGGAGMKKQLRMQVDLTTLEDTDSITAASFDARSARIKRGSIITSAYVNVITLATTGSASTLDIGLYDADTSSITVDDANGIAADITTVEMATVGEVHICDGALVSASGNTAGAGVVSVGATSNSDCQVILGYEESAFTAGVIELVVEYIEPQTAAVVN